MDSNFCMRLMNGNWSRKYGGLAFDATSSNTDLLTGARTIEWILWEEMLYKLATNTMFLK